MVNAAFQKAIIGGWTGDGDRLRAEMTAAVSAKHPRRPTGTSSSTVSRVLRTQTVHRARAPDLLGREGSDQDLERLERSGLFIVRLDDNTYRYHEVLRAHLEGELAELIPGDGLAKRYARAAELLGPELARFTSDPASRRSMTQRRTLARTVSLIEDL
jgi:hypothetical protein